MKKNVKPLVMILFMTIFVNACTQAAKPTEVDATGKQIQVSESDQGKEYSLNQGDALIIVLESNPSTGYDWEVEQVDNSVLQLSGEAVFKADSEDLGSPGKTTLTFDAVNSGSQDLTLIYHRSSEKNVQPAKTFSINVTVSGSTVEISNPAAIACVVHGLTRELRTTADGSQYGVCTFPDGSECDEWAFYRGECRAGQYTVAPTPVTSSASADSN